MNEVFSYYRYSLEVILFIVSSRTVKRKKKNKLRYSHIFSQFILTYLGGRKK